MDMFLLDLGLFFYRYQYFHDYLRQNISDSKCCGLLLNITVNKNVSKREKEDWKKREKTKRMY